MTMSQGPSTFPRRAAAALAMLLCPAIATAQSIGLNFTGVTVTQGMALNSNGGYAPPDNGGAVGPNNVVQLINGAFAVYNKTTGALQQPAISARQFWINAGVDPGTANNNLGVFNQRILFDPTTSRWIVAGLTADSLDNKVLIARSDTADPLGGWKAVSVPGNVGGDRFVDFTSMGVDANGVYVTTNNYPDTLPGSGFNSISIFSMPKADLLAVVPTTANMTKLYGVDSAFGNTLQPVTDFGPAKPHAPLVSSFPSSTDVNFFLRSDLTGTSGPGATLSAEPVVIETGTYKNPPSAAQPTPALPISTIDARISANVYQVGDVIYATHAMTVGSNAGIHWLKIDEETNLVIQEGILSSPDFDYFQPSIAANANGDVVIGFTRSGEGAGGNLSDFAVMGHTIGDVTTFGTPFLLKAGLVGNYNYFNGRWGDFTTTVVDPSNPFAFWTFQQFAQGTNVWATQITQIFVPEPGSIVLALSALAALWFTIWRQQRART